MQSQAKLFKQISMTRCGITAKAISKSGLFLISLAILLVCSPVSVVSAAGASYVTTLLRTDRQSIQETSVLATTIFPPNTAQMQLYHPLDSDTRGYLGFRLSSLQTIWFGMIRDRYGLRWFVSTDTYLSIVCNSGNLTWNDNACLGNYSDLVSPGGGAYLLELVRVTQGHYRAQLTSVTVSKRALAEIYTLPNQTVQTAWIESQEDWFSPADPLPPMWFRHYSPYYLNGTTNTYWPATTGTSQPNWLFTSPAGICPSHYGAIVNSADKRDWIDQSFHYGSGLICWIRPQW